MNRIVILPVIFLLLLGVGPAAADFSLPAWEMRKPLPPMPNAAFAEWVVDSEVHARLGLDLRSLRLVDGSEQEVPYVIITRRPRTTREALPVILLNQTRDDGQLRVELDLGGQRKFHNRIVLRLSGENYRLPVVLEGSRDQREWQTLRRNATVLHFRADRVVSSPEVAYDRCDFRFLRVTLGPGVPAEVDWQGIDCFEQRKEPGDLVVRPTTKVSDNLLEDERGRNSVVTYDLGQAGLPHQEIQLHFELPPDVLYSRMVEVFSGASPDGPWEYRGSRSLYRFLTNSEETITYDETADRYLRVVIRNFDDRPLILGRVTVRGVPRRMIFPTTYSPVYLFYGNDNARTPTYDLARQWNARGEGAHGVEIELARAVANPDYQPSAVSPVEENPWLIYVGLGIGVIIFGAFAVKLLKPREVSE